MKKSSTKAAGKKPAPAVKGANKKKSAENFKKGSPPMPYGKGK